MKKKKLYILIAVITILLIIFTKTEKGTTIGTWGKNRAISWGWNFGF
ncbi:ABC-type uncharacterized transport system permease subunit [Chryseobacterium flavum]|nr:hypothetical protein [Chryseobacterium flavum]